MELEVVEGGCQMDLWSALTVMIVSMVFVFIVLGLLWGGILLVSKVFKGRNQ